jgi:hypothetical protein
MSDLKWIVERTRSLMGITRLLIAFFEQSEPPGEKGSEENELYFSLRFDLNDMSNILDRMDKKLKKREVAYLRKSGILTLTRDGRLSRDSGKAIEEDSTRSAE